MMNHVTLVGRLTKDIKVHYTDEGRAVTNVSLAVPRNFRNTDGEYKTDFVKCTLWGRVAENTAAYCSKGSQIGVTGRVNTRKYTNSEDKIVFVADVVADQVQFISGRKRQESNDHEVVKADDNGSGLKEAILDGDEDQS